MQQLLALRTALYSVEFRSFVCSITGCEELTDRVDCSANAYVTGRSLHDFPDLWFSDYFRQMFHRHLIYWSFAKDATTFTQLSTYTHSISPPMLSSNSFLTESLSLFNNVLVLFLPYSSILWRMSSSVSRWRHRHQKSELHNLSHWSWWWVA